MMPTGQMPPSMKSSHMPEPRKTTAISPMKMEVIVKKGFNGIFTEKKRMMRKTAMTTAAPAMMPPMTAPIPPETFLALAMRGW